MAEYAHPEVLVDTAWVASHLDDPNVRLIEVDVDTSAYEQGHIPGAIGWNWSTQLCDRVTRDVISREELEDLLGHSGIRENTTLVVYGDSSNWFAVWAFWQLKIYGHADVRLMNGGRKKWLSEGRPLTYDVPQYPHAEYHATDPDFSIRAFMPEVRDIANGSRQAMLVDVRGPQEFTGEILAPPGLPETCQRAGHIPGAVNIPWEYACKPDGTFKSYEDLIELYGQQGVTGDTPIITYCRIGERSSHTWFVLKYLLGFEDVRNYDGSWIEWGNMVGTPIATAEGIQSPIPRLYHTIYMVTIPEPGAG